MSFTERKETELEKATRIFEAMSGVDPQLLEKSEKTVKVIPFERISKVLVACFCLIVLGATLFTRQGGSELNKGVGFMANDSASNVVSNEENLNSASAGEAESWQKSKMTEEMYVENAEVGEFQKGETTTDSQSLIGQEMVNKELTLVEVYAVDLLGQYIPRQLPTGYEFRSANLNIDKSGEEFSLSVLWSNDREEINIVVSKLAKEARTEEVQESLGEAQKKEEITTRIGDVIITYRGNLEKEEVEKLWEQIDTGTE